MKQPSPILFGAIVLALASLVYVEAQPRAIGNLLGKTDANQALVVAMAQPTLPYSRPRAIGNLLGKTDANQALVVTCPTCSGVLASSVTAAQTGANTGETTLFSTVVPANTLNADAQALRLTASGTCSVIDYLQDRTWRVRLGGTVLFEVTADCARWNLDVKIYRTGADAQYATGVFQSWGFDGGYWVDEQGHVGTGAVDLTAAQTLELTGQDATATDGGITFRAGTVEILR